MDIKNESRKLFFWLDIVVWLQFGMKWWKCMVSLEKSEFFECFSNLEQKLWRSWLSQASTFLAVNRQASWDHPKVALIVLNQQPHARAKHQWTKGLDLCFRKGAVFSTHFLIIHSFLFCKPVLIVFAMDPSENSKIVYTELLLDRFPFKFLLFKAQNGKNAHYISRKRIAGVKTIWLSQARTFLAVNCQASWDHPKAVLIVLNQQPHARANHQWTKMSNFCFRIGANFSTRF